MVTRPVVLALVLVMGCADRQGDRQGGAIAADHVGATMPTVTITKAGERPGRPPLIRLLVNVTAANPGPDQRWVVIQRNIPGDDGGGVDKLEQLAAGGVAIGKFLGTGGFYAVALAPGARLTIKNLEIGWWNG